MSITTDFAIDLTKRPRRNRQSPAIRGLIQETHLLPSQLVSPLFVLEGSQRREAISSMPGIERLSIDLLLVEVESLLKLGIQAVELFPVIAAEKKDNQGSEAWQAENLMGRAICALKKRFPELCVMADVALDPYTDHGHDGLLNAKGEVDNDSTLAALAKLSLVAAEAGADILAPSDMMDGRIGYLRQALDKDGFQQVGLLAYTAKYASSFYGPFREALQSAPRFGNKKGYQLNPTNRREALLEAALDEAEGADMLLVKPALAYLDIIAALKEKTNLPLGAYHVSGEYAMVMAAAEKGWLNAEEVFIESLLAIKRAGADFILTYAARSYAQSYWRSSLILS